MAKYQHLTKEQELALGAEIQAGAAAKTKLGEAKRISPKKQAQLKADLRRGEAAIEELVKANLGLVYNRAQVFKLKYPGAPEFDDLVQEGMAGLMTAIHKYDPARGNKFSTVAYYWISQAIGRGVNKTGKLVRLPENRIADYSKMTAIASKYEEAGLSATELEARIMEETGLSKVELVNIRNAASFPLSLNRRTNSGSEDDTRELMDKVGEDHHIPGVETSATTNAVFQELLKCIETLPALQRQVLAAQFSLPYEGNYMTPALLREQLALTPTRYRHALTNALGELRGLLAERELSLEDFLGE